MTVYERLLVYGGLKKWARHERALYGGASRCTVYGAKFCVRWCAAVYGVRGGVRWGRCMVRCVAV